jgi:archaemetzincin
VSAGVCILDASRHRVGERDGLLALLSEQLGVPARRLARPLDLERAFDASRRQHNATALLQQVLALGGSSAEKLMAVVDVDLYIPVLTFVFGQAQLDGTAGVVSTFRLHSEFYGMPKDPQRFRERLDKEVLHEVGHLYGLYHCHQFECVMRSSTYVEEIDLKRAAFCADCAGLLRAGAGRP